MVKQLIDASTDHRHISQKLPASPHVLYFHAFQASDAPDCLRIRLVQPTFSSRLRFCRRKATRMECGVWGKVYFGESDVVG